MAAADAAAVAAARPAATPIPVAWERESANTATTGAVASHGPASTAAEKTMPRPGQAAGLGPATFQCIPSRRAATYPAAVSSHRSVGRARPVRRRGHTRHRPHQRTFTIATIARSDASSIGRMARPSDEGALGYFSRSATSCATSVGVVPTWIPRASSASCFACAVPEEPEMIAPAWPIVFPGGAEKPAM